MKVRSFFAFSAGILFLSGCGRAEPAELTLWGGKQSTELLQGQAEAFMAENKDINVTVGIGYGTWKSCRCGGRFLFSERPAGRSCKSRHAFRDH